VFVHVAHGRFGHGHASDYVYVYDHDHDHVTNAALS
jgi:hypothetical protein